MRQHRKWSPECIQQSLPNYNDVESSSIQKKLDKQVCLCILYLYLIQFYIYSAIVCYRKLADHNQDTVSTSIPVFHVYAGYLATSHLKCKSNY